jgi:hypothetical protein
MPPSAREWSRSPTSHYRHGSLGIGPSDPSFTRTTWWTVPLSRDEFGSWLHAHVPHGLRADSDSGGSVESGGVWEQDQDFRAPSTAAHTRGWVNFAFMSQGHRLVVRVDTFIGARFARTVLVPQNTTSVRIQRTERSLGPHSRPHTTVRTVTDPGAVGHIVTMVNRLPGAMTTQFVASCPAARMERSYRLDFATPQGSYVATLPTTMCWPELTLTHNGSKAGPDLDPGQRWTNAVDNYLR